MISAGDIRKRQMYLNLNNTLNEGSINLLLGNCAKTSSVSIIETYFKNWPYASNGDSSEFTEAANILNSFMERSNQSNSNKAINLFTEMVLCKSHDMKSSKKILQSLKINNESLINECNKYIVCDRIINNHNKLVKKGINNLMNEAKLTSKDGVDNYVTSICEFIDNINMPFSIKYNVALENTIYLLDKQSLSYDRKNILESINDYFFVNADSDKLKAMSTVLRENEVYNENEKCILTESEIVDKIKDKAAETSKNIIGQLKSMPDKTPEGMKTVIKKLYTKSADNIIEETPNFLSWIRKFLIFSTVAVSPYLAVVAFFSDMVIQTKLKQSETEKIINSFKSELDKCEKKIGTCKTDKQEERLKEYKKELKKNITTLETYQDTLYSEKENNKRYEDSFEESVEFEFENHVTLKEYIEIYHPKVSSEVYKLREQLNKYCNAKYKKIYDKQCILLNSIEELKKFENSNPNSVQGYIGSDSKISIGIAQFLGIRYNELTDNNINQRDILSDICDNLQLNIDYDFCVMYEGEEDMYTIYLSFNKPILVEADVAENFNYDILRSCATIKVLEEQASDISEKDMDYLLTFVDNHIDNVDINTMSCIGQFFGTSNIVFANTLSNFLIETSDNIRKNETGTDKYLKLAKLQEGINSIGNSSPRYNKYLSIYDEYDNNKLLQESILMMDQLVLNETSAVSTLKMIQRKLKDNMTKLSDKDKQLSRQLDFSVDTMVRKMQMAATNNNREAVIKGSILPSASKLIKIAIVSAAGFAINPAIAVIGILGGIAASKHATNKEKQYILDEIDVQLQVVDKKIQLSDRAEDMKAMEELLKIQQKLKREKSRIQYNKKDYVPTKKE